MGMGGGGGTNTAVSEINVTPLIDVLLVLLIIFMVIVPVTPKGLSALVPQPPKDPTKSQPDPTTIVVSINPGSGAGHEAYLINADAFNKADIEPKLQSIYSVRAQKIMFVKGDPKVDYGAVADVINMGKEAGVDSIGIITPKVEQGD